MNRADAQVWVEDLLDETSASRAQREPPALGVAPEPEPAPDRFFSPFLVEHVEEAQRLTAELNAAAGGADDEEAALDAVRGRVEELRAEVPLGVLDHAVKVFVTHNPVGRTLRLPALETRAPLKVVPSTRGTAPAEVAKDPELRLAWFREDPEANEHHDHWHVVYPTAGIEDPPGSGRFRLQDRQGELFVYMHQQMLARYDHERLAAGLGLVQPLARYDDDLLEGYDPARGLAGFPPEFTRQGRPIARPAGVPMADAFRFVDQQGQPREIPRARLHTWGRAFTEAVSTGRLRERGGGTFPVTIDAFGRAIEPSLTRAQSQDPGPGVADPAAYGNLHGLGHLLVSQAGGAADGVMSDTDTAIRDPVFYRWHRHVDQLAYDWQERQPEHPHVEWAAPVTIEQPEGTATRPGDSPDLFLFWEDAVPEAWEPGTGIDTLETRMERRPLRFAGKDVPPDLPQVEIPYLDQRPFGYAVRLRNDTDEARHVTLRLFFVSDELFDERRQWIELDKWLHPLGAGEQGVSVRLAQQSAVIRKPGLKPPGPTQHSPRERDENTYCECGWPYNLLIPRGTGEGMPFWLVAVATDAAQDQVLESDCGSISYCGAKTDRYPDSKPMGYPFDRPVAGGPLAICSWPNAAARSFAIRWLNPE
jgi:hypothetical protein